MPLLRTPPSASRKQRNKIRSQNIETEMAAGKPQDQAVAIAYSVERRKRKKKAGTEMLITRKPGPATQPTPKEIQRMKELEKIRKNPTRTA